VSPKSNIAKIAADFAERIQHLLNATVCDGARLGVIAPDAERASIGTGLGVRQPPSPVPLLTSGNVPVWLSVTYRVFLDSTGYLTVDSSAYVVSAGDPPQELVHYDYERDKTDYPDAHLQIRATSPAWDALLESVGLGAGSLHKIHLPVGGRRYRPALEDIIESLVVEGILQPRTAGWRTVLAESREDFRRRQLKAAVRRDPDSAIVALQSMGYTVTEPDRSPEQPKVIPLSRINRRRRRNR
jgi:hypothetical protein